MMRFRGKGVEDITVGSGRDGSLRVTFYGEKVGNRQVIYKEIETSPSASVLQAVRSAARQLRSDLRLLHSAKQQPQGSEARRELSSMAIDRLRKDGKKIRSAGFRFPRIFRK